MTQVDHNATAIHFRYDLTSVGRQAAMLTRGSTSRVAYIVVAIVAERDVDHAHTCESLYVCHVLTQRIAILYTAHDGKTARHLVAIEVGRRESKAYARCFLYSRLYLRKEPYGHIGGSLRSLRRTFALRDVGHHDGCIEHAFAHFRKIYEQLRITTCQGYAFVEKHGRITVRIERKHAAMHILSASLLIGRFYESLHERHHTLVAVEQKAFGVPLYAHYPAGFLRALDSFYHAVG